MTALVSRLFPPQVDNRFEGQRASLWLLGLFIALKTIMSVNSILNPAKIATGDGLPLASYGAEAAGTVLLLFSLNAMGQLTLVLIALLVLVRYRALVPLILLVLFSDALARRLINQAHGVAIGDTSPIIWVLVYGLVAVLAAGLVLSLIPRRSDRR